MLDEKRNGRITASAIGAILGCAPYATRADVMRRMVREHFDAPKEFLGNAATEYGTNNETAAIMEVELATDLVIDHGSFFIHPNISWLGATPDGFTTIAGERLVVEIKCPYGLRNEKVPQFKPIAELPHYYAQVQAQMACTGLKRAIFCQWNPNDSIVEEVQFNPEYWDSVEDELRAFWVEYLQELKDEKKYSRHLQPLRAELPDSNQLAKKYSEAKQAHDEAKEYMESCKAALIESLPEGTTCATIGGLSLTQVEKEGAISYSKAVSDLLPSADLSAYRGEPSKYWLVK